MTERMLGPVGSTRRRRFYAVPLALLAAIVLVLGVSAAGGASLPGSTFEIDTDANLTVEGASPALDWKNVSDTKKNDLATGSGDDSFGQGSKEDTAIPAVVDGSIPPNKSDLKTFGVYQEETANGKFLHLFWSRVQDPSGTTNMDFEFNKSTTTSSNGVTPVRTAGDLLITYDLSKGGTVPVLSLREWTGSAWGAETNLTTSGDATGSINTSPITSGNSDGLGALDPRTFGEASVDLDAIFDAGKCDSFGSAYLKSRSSDSFDAALKDFIAPQSVNIANCGSVVVRKQTDPDEDPNATDFSYTSTLVTDPADATAASFSLKDDGVKTVSNVVAGTGYTVTESDLSTTGYVLSGIDCSASSTGSTYTTDVANQKVTFNVVVGKTIDCTFTNTRLPKVKLVKDLEPASDTGTFNLDITQGGVSKASASGIGDGGAAPASGFVTVAAGSVTVSETAAGTTALADYAKSIACTGKTGNTGQASYTFNIANGEEVTCTITNTRLPKVKLVKDLIPGNDTGTFNLDITQGGVSKASASGIGDGGAAPASGFVTVAAGNVTVSETAGSAVLADYAKQISCDSSKGSAAANATSYTFAIANGESVTCTITNTRRTFTVVAYVCETTGGTATLYSSNVTLPNPGGTQKATQSSLPSGVTADTLCGLAANYPGLSSGDHTAKVSIAP